METNNIRERCKINVNFDADTFVGIKCINGDLKISFPLGFRLSNDEKLVKKDILLLLNVLADNSDKKKSEINTQENDNIVIFPIYSYLYVINDFFNRGIYKEREILYRKSKKGKINWSRTIKTQKTYINNGDIIYLDFITKNTNMNENELISLIHEYCVYESFLKVGWLFTSYLPSPPQIKFNKKRFVAVIKSKLAQTYNDRNKQLFINMLKIVISLGDDGTATDFQYGTNRFEYVWEKMIDRAYGIKEKKDYFPKTRWELINSEYENSYLQPDTIMIANNKVYVLDAKYYKYGQTKRASDLPDSTSINKQITYGEYIAESNKFNVDGGNVYNAFLMPYNSKGEIFDTDKEQYYIGSAYSDWKSADGTKTYEQVEGILIDVNSLMRDYSYKESRVIELAQLIENNIKNE